MSDSSPTLRIGIAVSVAVHLVALIAGLGYAGFLLVPSGPEQTIAVDLVTPQEVANLIKPPKPEAAPPAPDKGNEPSPAAPPPSPATTETAKPEPPTQQANAPEPEPVNPATQAQPQPAIRPPEPDLSLRYPTNLSLYGSMPGDFDRKASRGAQVDESAIAAFRAQLKACSTLPPEIAPDDKVVIVIRAQFAPDARLATAPILIEASASAKGPLLMRAAIAGLQACQPYSSLPPDKYQEWKLLDLSFTPQDFKRG